MVGDPGRRRAAWLWVGLAHGWACALAGDGALDRSPASSWAPLADPLNLGAAHWNPGVEMRLIHIPKTAGRTITREGRVPCLRMPQVVANGSALSPYYWPVPCSSWHTPPRLFARDPYVALGFVTICVTRHPLDRLVSEFKMRQPDHLARPLDEQRRQLNEFVLQTLGEMRAHADDPQLDVRSGRLAPHQFYRGSDCHLLPQFWYVYDGGGSEDARRRTAADDSDEQPRGAPRQPRRTCMHVLRFERLDADFTALLRAYGRSGPPGGRLARHDGEIASRGCELTPRDLWRNATAAAREVYADDLRLFRYAPEWQPPPPPPKQLGGSRGRLRSGRRRRRKA